MSYFLFVPSASGSHLVGLDTVRLHIHDAVAVNLVGVGVPGDPRRVVGHIRKA